MTSFDEPPRRGYGGGAIIGAMVIGFIGGAGLIVGLAYADLDASWLPVSRQRFDDTVNGLRRSQLNSIEMNRKRIDNIIVSKAELQQRVRKLERKTGLVVPLSEVKPVPTGRVFDASDFEEVKKPQKPIPVSETTPIKPKD